MSEEKIEWESLRALDPQALSALHQRYYPEVFRLAAYRVGDRMLAEDLASEAFVRLIDALHAGKGPGRNIRGWLLGTTHHIVNDHFRNTYRQVLDPLTEKMLAVEDSVSQIDRQLTVGSDLHTALNALTEEQQMVIELRFGAELSLEETAQVMGKKPNAIKALQFRATAALRRAMEKLGDE